MPLCGSLSREPLQLTPKTHPLSRTIGEPDPFVPSCPCCVERSSLDSPFPMVHFRKSFVRVSPRNLKYYPIRFPPGFGPGFDNSRALVFSPVWLSSTGPPPTFNLLRSSFRTSPVEVTYVLVSPGFRFLFPPSLYRTLRLLVLNDFTGEILGARGLRALPWVRRAGLLYAGRGP